MLTVKSKTKLYKVVKQSNCRLLLLVQGTRMPCTSILQMNTIVI